MTHSRDVWIPLSDGVRLAARLWLPERRPAPAILEYLPYRKNDATARRDAQHFPYFAEHGYAGVRVDMRGSGDSDGILLDEYLKQEQDDGLEVLTWIAAQPWCDGNVGIVGISWGGFNGLQIAARRPPELKAVVSICSTDDRYADDVHYMGGCLLDTNLGWATTMLAYNARPPDPAAVGDGWRDLWLDRLDRTPPYIHAWLSHQRRDGYWQHGSVCEDYAAITCPVLLAGGWADGYPNAIPRLLSGLRAPRQAIIGPWGHQYPEAGVPGPAIDFLPECVRFFDQSLSGADSHLPMLRAWIQHSIHPPRDFYLERPGRWVAEPTWPPWVEPRRWDFGGGTADSSQPVGLASGARTGFGRPGDAPGDQQDEDARSLCFTFQPLPVPLDVLGYPEVELEVAADQPWALVAVRLCEVAPEGTSALISRGLLNLTHREGHVALKPVEPGVRYRVRIRLNVIGYAVPAGHRLRVAISPTYWPFAWPSPRPVTLTVFGGYLELPVRPPRPEDAAVSFGPPVSAPPLPVEILRPATARRRADSLVEDSAWRLPDGLTYDVSSLTRWHFDAADPLSARIDCQRRIGVSRDAWSTVVEATATLTASAETFHVETALLADAGHERVFERAWRFDIPRDLV